MKFLIINGADKFANMGSELNKWISEKLQAKLEANSHEVLISNVEKEYSLDEEVNKWDESDVVIFHFPLWWMNMPSKAKLYFDNVLMHANFAHQKLWANDGRTRSNPDAKYGSGGLSQNKKYMIIVTMNAPKEAFSKEQFFGVSFEESLISVHKMFQFLGMKPLKSLAIDDVIKNPNIEKFSKELENHIDEMLNNL